MASGSTEKHQKKTGCPESGAARKTIRCPHCGGTTFEEFIGVLLRRWVTGETGAVTEWEEWDTDGTPPVVYCSNCMADCTDLFYYETDDGEKVRYEDGK